MVPKHLLVLVHVFEMLCKLFSLFVLYLILQIFCNLKLKVHFELIFDIQAAPFQQHLPVPNKKCKLHLSLFMDVKIFCSFTFISLKPSIVTFRISIFHCSSKSSTQSLTLCLSAMVFLRFNNILGSWSVFFTLVRCSAVFSKHFFIESKTVCLLYKYLHQKVP